MTEDIKKGLLGIVVDETEVSKGNARNKFSYL